MSAENWFTLEVPARPENVAFVRVAVAAFASQLDFTLNELEDLKIAVSEAVSNAVLHAYPEGGVPAGPTTGGYPGSGTVTVRARAADGTLTVTVADRGRGIADVDQARQTGYSTLPDRMGMGFLFMEAFTDAMDVTAAPGAGTTVTLMKRPAGPESEAAGGTPEAEPSGAGSPGTESGPESAAAGGSRARSGAAGAAAGQVALDFDPGDDGPAPSRT